MRVISRMIRYFFHENLSSRKTLAYSGLESSLLRILISENDKEDDDVL